MNIEIRANSDILGDGTNFRTVVDKSTNERIFHLGEKNGKVHLWTNKMVPVEKICAAINALSANNKL